jgi:cysteine-rich repeat protein
MRSINLVLGSLILVATACGDSGSPAGDDDGVLPAPAPVCGNILLEGDEACDDGNHDADDGCSPACVVECGDGLLGANEQCDPQIAAGAPGACPTPETCADADPCTTAIVSGSGCAVTCEFAPITAPIEGDACCPDGANATTDGDCEPICGNGVVEAGEGCDTAIIDGLGACPTACSDGEDCTADALVGGGTCAAACRFTDITAPANGDRCCPAGANPQTDDDCSTTCGDGAVTGDETCDTAITSGPLACPTSCNDGEVCTADALVNAGTCRAACTATDIPAGQVDLCCPEGADLGDDPDCAPACGDGVITEPETCDDDNAQGGDGCSATCRLEPVGFRFTDLDLRDPHAFARVSILGCTDVTDLELFGNRGVNPTIQFNLTTDDDGDGLFDLSAAQTFTPFVQAAGTTSATDLVFPDCTVPASSSICTLAADASHIPATATSATGSCLTTVAGTTSGYDPAVRAPTAPAGGSCYKANAGTITIVLAGLPIQLQDAQIGGVWFGNPATEIRDGLIRGFLSETAANQTIIPEGTTGIDSIDGEPLSSLFKGGGGNCRTASPAVGDKDSFTPPGGPAISGWYVYLNFTARRTTYVEQ